MKDIYRVLDELGIKRQKHEYRPVFTVEEAEAVSRGTPGAHCKNLFLRDANGNKHFIVEIKVLVELFKIC